MASDVVKHIAGPYPTRRKRKQEQRIFKNLLWVKKEVCFVFRGVLKQQTNAEDWGSLARLALENLNKPRKGSDVGDHPPITPMRLASRNHLDHDSWRVYDYIVRHFIATVCCLLTGLQPNP